jgi:ComF family protein
LNIGTRIGQLMPAQPCALCGAMSRDGSWCAACDRALPVLPRAHCPNCALPTPSGELCGHCLRHPPLFDRAVAAYAYAYPLDRLVQAMKYRERLALADAFAARLAQRIEILPDCAIAMPLHPAKLRERGFNQSLLLAAAIARARRIKLLPHACRRVRDTPPQSALPWKERKKNVRDAFRCEQDMGGLHVALVDDVLTTGASLNALAAAVKARGAAEVSVWVVARTLPHK